MKLPPRPSIARVMSMGLRVGVPLKSMCSIKWEIPAVFALSWREPEATKTPNATLSASHGTRTTRKPLSSVKKDGLLIERQYSSL